jgi:phosphatidylinositol glycan class O
VDDGVWSHLLPLVGQPGEWDVIVAHYLGVDHVGHSWGVQSQEMADKLRQMDDQMRDVVQALVDAAGPGGAFERTLLIITGDHGAPPGQPGPCSPPCVPEGGISPLLPACPAAAGQTLDGNHGGGSPEEVDSVLVAVDASALRAGGRAFAEFGAACRETCTCGDDLDQCADDLLQVDAVPTLAALLGIPIPFGNMGTVSPELWGLAVAKADGQQAANAPLAAVLRCNADQVRLPCHRWCARGCFDSGLNSPATRLPRRYAHTCKRTLHLDCWTRRPMRP